MKSVVVSCLSVILIVGCGQQNASDKRLPILGRKELKEVVLNGQKVLDTVYHTIADFEFVNQDSAKVNNQTFVNKIYIADFFFTTCPTICPKMKAQMLRVYDSIGDNPDIKILSHTIDPKHDSVAVLHDFAERLGVTSNKWHFVTGNKDDIYRIGQTSYMVSAVEDPSEPGGYIHSGAFILVDRSGRIRGMYDGTKADQVDRLIRDMWVLLKEENNPGDATS